MIKINLYPYKKPKRGISIEFELGIYVFILLFITISLYFLNIKLNNHINQLANIKTQKQNINKLLNKKVKIVNNYKKQLKELNYKIKIIKRIRKNQNMPVIYLNELVTNFIKDKLWFTRLKLSPKKNIELSGVALDNQILAHYIRNLRHSKYIKEVYLKQAAKRKIMGYNLVAFSFKLVTKKSWTKKNNESR